MAAFNFGECVLPTRCGPSLYGPSSPSVAGAVTWQPTRPVRVDRHAEGLWNKMGCDLAISAECLFPSALFIWASNWFRAMSYPQ